MYFHSLFLILLLLLESFCFSRSLFLSYTFVNFIHISTDYATCMRFTVYHGCNDGELLTKLTRTLKAAMITTTATGAAAAADASKTMMIKTFERSSRG